MPARAGASPDARSRTPLSATLAEPVVTATRPVEYASCDARVQAQRSHGWGMMAVERWIDHAGQLCPEFTNVVTVRDPVFRAVSQELLAESAKLDDEIGEVAPLAVAIICDDIMGGGSGEGCAAGQGEAAKSNHSR